MGETLEYLGKSVGVFNETPKEVKDVLEKTDKLKKAIPAKSRPAFDAFITAYDSKMQPFFDAFKSPIIYKKNKPYHNFMGEELPVPSVKQQFFTANEAFYTNTVKPLLKEIIKAYDNSISSKQKDLQNPTSKINELKKLKEDRAYQLKNRLIREGDFVDESLKAQIDQLEKSLVGVGANETVDSTISDYDKRVIISNLLDSVELEIYRNNEAASEAKTDAEMNYEHDGRFDYYTSVFWENFWKLVKPW